MLSIARATQRSLAVRKVPGCSTSLPLRPCGPRLYFPPIQPMKSSRCHVRVSTRYYSTPQTQDKPDDRASFVENDRTPHSGIAAEHPVYQVPMTGILSMLPSSWVPFAELMRLDKPAGTYYLFFPCLFSTLLAAPLATPIASPLQVLSTTTLFFAGALVMRGAGCTINDLWDRNLDPYVARTRLRPLARKALTPQAAIVFLGFELLAGLAILLRFPTHCLFYGVPSLLFVATYPVAMRVT